ncbi:RNA polymerase II-associated protein 3 [Biomphalaria pfeifferi]|uniref:RNA polymerase II-associated protein 3 n=1 Tax=Biomphalaria pfeifferi TaxID=112525 RepID=A0AAD8ARW9_BIOPF|nr:RNA polymerase II-associated protein 3 [Biomphalaria pfeifferi]
MRHEKPEVKCFFAEGMEHVVNKPDAETELPDLRLVEEQHRRAESLAEKEKGNEFYKSGQLDRAIEAYSKGLKFQPNDPLLLSNRAQSYLKLQKYTECDADCSLSLQYDPSYVKSYLRRSSARSALGRHAEAVDDLKQALEIEPTNQEAKKALERLQALQSKKDVGHDQKSDEYKKVPGHMTQETLDLKQQYSVYGKHECLMLEGTEGDLHLHYKNCTKNPGHSQFIPIRAFTLQHLPDEFRDEDLFQLIKATADLTVRISVNMGRLSCIAINRPLRSLSCIAINGPLKSLSCIAINRPLKSLSCIAINRPIRSLSCIAINGPLKSLSCIAINRPLKSLSCIAINIPIRSLSCIAINGPLKSLSCIAINH